MNFFRESFYACYILTAIWWKKVSWRRPILNVSWHHFVSFQCPAECLLITTDGVYRDAPCVQLAFPRHSFSTLYLVYLLVVTLPSPHFLGTVRRLVGGILHWRFMVDFLFLNLDLKIKKFPVNVTFMALRWKKIRSLSLCTMSSRAMSTCQSSQVHQWLS